MTEDKKNQKKEDEISFYKLSEILFPEVITFTEEESKRHFDIVNSFYHD